MRLPRVKLSVRRSMGLVAIAAIALGVVDETRARFRAARYARRAEYLEWMELRSREIDAMDSATRARAAAEAFDNPFLDNPDWNRRMIPYLRALKDKYRHAAEHPREPIPPDPPTPN